MRRKLEIGLEQPVEPIAEQRTERVRRALERVQQGELFEDETQNVTENTVESVIERMRLISETIQESSASINTSETE